MRRRGKRRGERGEEGGKRRGRRGRRRGGGEIKAVEMCRRLSKRLHLCGHVFHTQTSEASNDVPIPSMAGLTTEHGRCVILETASPGKGHLSKYIKLQSSVNRCAA